jgi:hypothetical protein
VRSARTAPPPVRTGFGLASPRSAALAAGMAPSVAIVLTDRRMFLVRGSNRSGMRVVRRAAVKVLHYDTTGPSIVLWLNIDSQPIGFDIPTGLRTSTDALARALGTPPPSFTHPEDR